MSERKPNLRLALPLFLALLLAVPSGCTPGGSSGSGRRSRTEKLESENRELRREIADREKKLNGRTRAMVRLAVILTTGCAVLFLAGTATGSKARSDHDRRRL
mgnify:CR=1 FL=1